MRRCKLQQQAHEGQCTSSHCCCISWGSSFICRKREHSLVEERCRENGCSQHKWWHKHTQTREVRVVYSPSLSLPTLRPFPLLKLPHTHTQNTSTQSTINLAAWTTKLPLVEVIHNPFFPQQQQKQQEDSCNRTRNGGHRFSIINGPFNVQ